MSASADPINTGPLVIHVGCQRDGYEYTPPRPLEIIEAENSRD